MGVSVQEIADNARGSSIRPRHRDPIAARRPGDGTPQGLAALRKQLDILNRARQAERNHTLNRCALIVGLFIASGHLREVQMPAAVADTAHRIGLSPWEPRRTIDSAFDAQAASSSVRRELWISLLNREEIG